jgi:cation diffusion facilitator CzcD-associated flavoprotein CzcO/acetyl esterase/lipase
VAPLLPRRAVHAALRALGPAVRSERLPLRFRRALTDRASIAGSPPPGVSHAPRALGGVSGDWVEPRQRVGPGCALYLHGGGYVLGSAASHRNVVAHLVDRLGAPAFVANYRLAPEHPWPAALDDAVAAYQALLRERPGEPIAVIGDSAGGGLALSLAMALRDQGAPAPAVIAMICPWLDLASPRNRGRGDGVLDASALDRWAHAYAPGGTDRSDPSVSPLLGQLAGLPPLVVHSASLDPLVEDARQLDIRARDAGADITTTEYPGLWHDFHLFAGRLRDADRALTDLAAQLSRHVGARRDPRVVVVGAGMSGLCMGAKLRAAGMSDFTILEKASDIGGTWRENTYPGLSCDVPSRFYSYSFLPNPSWTSVFSPGGEIQGYFQRATDELELRPHIELGVEVDQATWTGVEWEVVAADGRRWSADALITATGVLHHPRFPDIDGVESFEGAAFHSARWDHSVPLGGRRIAVIGTGSTGAQIVAAIAGDVEQLYVLQRSAQWILPVPNLRYSERSQRLLARRPILNRASYSAYRFVLGNVFARAVTQPGLLRRAVSAACRWNLRLGVRDPALRRTLTPDHQPMCRRLIMSAGYYPAVQRPNVEVVTTSIERVEPTGVRLSDGRLLEVDVIVFATGFDAHAYMRPMKVTGPDGWTLDEEWAEGPRGYRTVALPGFPNLFTLMGPHSPIGNSSLISVAEAQADYIVGWLEEMRRGSLQAVAPTRAATEAFNAEMRAAMPNTIWTSGCTSWYLGKDGLPELWPWTPERHRTMLQDLHAEEFEVVSAPAPSA